LSLTPRLDKTGSFAKVSKKILGEFAFQGASKLKGRRVRLCLTQNKDIALRFYLSGNVSFEAGDFFCFAWSPTRQMSLNQVEIPNLGRM